ncbi:MAG TPA: beta-galactosidase, partial [Algoriphagus sp.]|nr:beta-galactosidase [Algoriphagus sp.]
IPWSPEQPHLYDVKIKLLEGSKVIDEVSSYAAFREVKMAKAQDGHQRIFLNGEALFHYGPLDQGWWPDGLYTAPTDEALAFDIEKTKEMGFNMIRKHVKVEPARWYYHADKLGMLVWQDMPSGDMGNKWEIRPGVIREGTSKERNEE